MNKENILYISVLTLLLSISGCSGYLDREPLTSLSPGSFWNTEKDLRMALNYCYNQMNRAWNMDNQSADCFAAVGNNVSSGTLTPSNTDDNWTKAYTVIRITNDFLNNYALAQVSDNIKNRYAGEARFFRGYFYFNLIKRFGDVPYVTETLDLNSPELYGSRESKDKVLEKIIEDLEFAESHIPVKSGMSADVGRITKGTVQAFMARVCLYYGTYYKFHSQGNSSLYLQKAKEAAKRVIDSKEYGLYENYRDLFLLPGEDSKEHILSYRYSEEANTYNDRPRSVIIDFKQEPTKNLADAFLCKDGLPIGKSSYKIEYLPIGTEFTNRDPRMALTLWKPGDSFMGDPFLPNLANQTRTGYMFKKYGDEASYTNLQSRIDEILIRYAEVLLIYAEAAYELEDKISDGDLDISVNALRNRFTDHPDKLPALTNAFVNQYGLNMREEIRRERRVELASESFRYDDLIRWKTAETELPQEILGAKFDNDAYSHVVPGKDINLNAEGFIVVQSGSSRGFDTSKHYLFPLPLRELSLNPDLKQNPGW
ncbi:RagB/SusD family nutrient uptake outer membrane protein [Parabacteroides sp. PF5-6]|uniref:RagB/SusD family nutrient uptake outer membrane protein n=1 Tax=Parabacteroides sp. PF5-6 TaxID=1742403 RepID=UPI0024070F6C|nr:RagB/SusD family nutrient uptake outer membrane protein [Parabacteroides sp. PF5-6]MDF9829771.1 hypothetical protein [Parabacteroides sp. PF5-6]